MFSHHETNQSFSRSWEIIAASGSALPSMSTNPAKGLEAMKGMNPQEDSSLPFHGFINSSFHKCPFEATALFGTLRAQNSSDWG